MNDLNRYRRLKHNLYDTLERLYREEKTLSRRDFTRFTLRLYDTSLMEGLEAIEKELQALEELK